MTDGLDLGTLLLGEALVLILDGWLGVTKDAAADGLSLGLLLGTLLGEALRPTLGIGVGASLAVG